MLNVEKDLDYAAKDRIISKYNFFRQIYKFWGNKNAKSTNPYELVLHLPYYYMKEIINYRLLAHSFVLH